LNKLIGKIIRTSSVLLFLYAFGLPEILPAALFRIKANQEDSIVVRQSLEKFAVDLGKVTGSVLIETIDVVIATDIHEFNLAVGSDVPDWGAAVAIKSKQLIVVKSPRFFPVGKSLNELIGHELAHLALDNAVNGKWLPRWFEEGFCQMISGEWRFEQDLLLTRAVWGSGLLPLIELEGLNRFSGAKAGLAYAESYLAVSAITRELGIDFYQDFFEEYRANSNFFQAFEKASGYKYLDWTNLWLRESLRKYRFVLFIFDSRLFFPFLAIIFLLLYVIKIRQVRKKKKEWQRLERYWNNDQDYPTQN
jgi:hypothetical protein